MFAVTALDQRPQNPLHFQRGITGDEPCKLPLYICPFTARIVRLGKRRLTERCPPSRNNSERCHPPRAQVVDHALIYRLDIKIDAVAAANLFVKVKIDVVVLFDTAIKLIADIISDTGESLL